MFGRIRAIIKGSKSKKISPTITQPRQLKKTMEKMRSEFKQFAGKKAKTAKDRANVVRTKKSIERMKKLDKLQEKRKEGIKASKGVKDMIGRGEATKVGKSVFHKFVREKKAEGGIAEKPIYKFKDEKGNFKKPKAEGKPSKIYERPKAVPLKRKEMKKGGRTLKPVDKEKNPGLAKLPTQVRNKMGYMKDGGAVKPKGKVLEAIKEDYKKSRPPKNSRKFGGGKK